MNKSTRKAMTKGTNTPIVSNDRLLKSYAETINMQAEELDKLQTIVTSIVVGYSRETGNIDIPLLCRNMAGDCWCGCHKGSVTM